MTDLAYDGRHEYTPHGGTPRPPADIEAAMMAAGKAGDEYALAVERAKYAAWLADVHGIREGIHGVELPDGAIR